MPGNPRSLARAENFPVESLLNKKQIEGRTKSPPCAGFSLPCAWWRTFNIASHNAFGKNKQESPLRLLYLTVKGYGMARAYVVSLVRCNTNTAPATADKWGNCGGKP